MAIAYHLRGTEEFHWSDLWERQRLDDLLAVAVRDPLSKYLERHLPPSGPILEGGCGLGQYVIYLGDRGYYVIGGDSSLTALHIHRQAYPDSPLLGLDLRRLPFVDDALQGHISIGVVEHLEEGPHELLCEFYRTLSPGGILLLAVPWVNLYRRLTMPMVRRRQRRLRAAGARFYQYAFTRAEIRAFLERAGFRVRAFYPYSPGKGMREISLLLRCGALWKRVVPGGYPPYETARNAKHGGVPEAPSRDREEVGGGSVSGVRRFLYWPPVLWTFAHMILAVAQKPEA